MGNCFAFDASMPSGPGSFDASIPSGQGQKEKKKLPKNSSSLVINLLSTPGSDGLVESKARYLQTFFFFFFCS